MRNDLKAILKEAYKRFLGSHSGFTRSELQGYLNLFCFISNPPSDKYEKIEKLQDLTFRNPKMLRYRV